MIPAYCLVPPGYCTPAHNLCDVLVYHLGTILLFVTLWHILWFQVLFYLLLYSSYLWHLPLIAEAADPHSLLKQYSVAQTLQFFPFFPHRTHITVFLLTTCATFLLTGCHIPVCNFVMHFTILDPLFPLLLKIGLKHISLTSQAPFQRMWCNLSIATILVFQQKSSIAQQQMIFRTLFIVVIVYDTP